MRLLPIIARLKAECPLLQNRVEPAYSLAAVDGYDEDGIPAAFVYPFRLKKGKKIPVLVVILGFAFNVFNGYLNGRYLGMHAGEFTLNGLADLRFMFGTGLFISGMAITAG